MVYAVTSRDDDGTLYCGGNAITVGRACGAAKKGFVPEEKIRNKNVEVK